MKQWGGGKGWWQGTMFALPISPFPIAGGLCAPSIDAANSDPRLTRRISACCYPAWRAAFQPLCTRVCVQLYRTPHPMHGEAAVHLPFAECNCCSAEPCQVLPFGIPCVAESQQSALRKSNRWPVGNFTSNHHRNSPVSWFISCTYTRFVFHQTGQRFTRCRFVINLDKIIIMLLEPRLTSLIRSVNTLVKKKKKHFCAHWNVNAINPCKHLAKTKKIQKNVASKICTLQYCTLWKPALIASRNETVRK